jgi:hypothetical protein
MIRWYAPESDEHGRYTSLIYVGNDLGTVSKGAMGFDPDSSVEQQYHMEVTTLFDSTMILLRDDVRRIMYMGAVDNADPAHETYLEVLNAC